LRVASFIGRSGRAEGARWRGGAALALSLGLAACGPEAWGGGLVGVGVSGSGGAGGTGGSAGGGQAGGGGRAGGSAASDRDGDGVVDGDDCAPDDAARSSQVGGLYVDRDGDGFTAGGPVEACLGAEGPPG
jgi:hypothetical protein